jgi:hypothetical protein
MTTWLKVVMSAYLWQPSRKKRSLELVKWISALRFPEDRLSIRWNAFA